MSTLGQAYRKNRIFAFLFALIIIYGIFVSILGVTQNWFLPFIEDKGWLEQDYIPEHIARTGIAFIFVFIVFTYGAMLIYGLLGRE